MQIIIIVLGMLLVLLGRIITGRWYNALSIYSGVWTLSLFMYFLQLLPFYNITEEALAYILAAWTALSLGFIGSYLLVLGIYRQYTAIAPSGISRYTCHHLCPTSYRLYAILTVLLSGVSVINVLYRWISIIGIFGGIGEVIGNLHQVFLLRISGNLPTIPYLWPFALVASFFGGIYTALSRRLSLISLIPFIVVGLNSIAAAGRIGVVMALILWITPIFYLCPSTRSQRKSTRRAIITVFVIALLVVALVSANRGLRSKFPGMHEGLIALREYVPFLPSFYYYIAHPPVVFSEVVKYGEHGQFPAGLFTFRWIFNVLSKLGLVNPPPTFGACGQAMTPFIDTGVVDAPTGSWLRAFYSDFGPLGIITFPLGFGIALGFLTAVVSKQPNLVLLALLSHLMVVIILSYAWNVMQFGFWVQSLSFSLIISMAVSLRSKQHARLG